MKACIRRKTSVVLRFLAKIAGNVGGDCSVDTLCMRTALACPDRTKTRVALELTR